MLRQHHVTARLSEYCHRQLDPERSRLVEAHLRTCARCRRDLQDVQFGISLAGQLPRLSAPASIWEDIEAALDQKTSEAGNGKRLRGLSVFAPLRLSTNWPRLTAAALVLLIAVASSVWLYTRQSATPADDDVAFWEVAQLEGAPKIGVRGIQGTGQLRVGEWLETDNSSRAKINVGEIGHVEVDPNSRLRLVEADESEHRLSLVRGRLSAVIWAPPRLFFVDTPSAVAVDYGCAYTLEVDESGGSLLQVTSGWVALELDGQESMVPAGAACETRPVTGPGTPYFFDAPPAFRAALRKFDFESGSTDALADVLREARKQDTLSIWHLLARAAPGEQRHLVYTRLAQFISPPAGVTKEGALRLDREMLQRWRDELQAHWFTE